MVCLIFTYFLEAIRHFKIGQDLLILKAKLSLINGYLRLICDEKTSIFEKENLIKNTNMELNYSQLKINSYDELII